MASILAIFIQAGLAAVVSRIVYLCYFHPLARYPGPIWARFTDIWRFLNFLSGQHHLSEQHLHEKYGHVVRVAPDWLSFSDLDEFEAIYGVNKSIEKSDFYIFGRADTGSPGSIFSAKTEAQHREKKRKVVGPAFSSVKVARYEPIVEKHVSMFLERVDALFNTSRKSSGAGDGGKKEATVNIAPAIHQFTMDTMLEIIYGSALASHPFTESSVSGDICAVLRNINKMAWSCSLWPFFGWVMNSHLADYLVRRPRYNEEGEVIGLYAILNAGRVAITQNPENLAASTQPGVIKSWLEIPVEEASRMSLAELIAESSNLVFAGPGSTAAALTAVLFQLGTEEGQKWQEKLRQETHTVQDPLGGAFSLDLQAVIKETLRYHAAFPTAFPRVIIPGAETAIPNLPAPLPVGTTVSANTYVLGRSRALWGDDADQWIPERWLGDEQHRRTMENKFVAFGKGSRGCVGRDLAWLVIARAVRVVVRRAKLRSVGDLFGKSYLEMQYDCCNIEYTPLSS